MHNFDDWTDNELIRTKSKLIADRHKLRDEFLESGPWIGLTGRELAEMRLQISKEIEALSDEILRRATPVGEDNPVGEGNGSQ